MTKIIKRGRLLILLIPLVLVTLAFSYGHIYLVTTVETEGFDVIAGHGKQLILYRTAESGNDINAHNLLNELLTGGPDTTLEEDMHCYDLSDPGSPTFTLLCVRGSSVIALGGNVYVQSFSKPGETYDEAFADTKRVATPVYFKFTPAGFVQIKGAEFARVNSAYESNSVVSLDGNEMSALKGSGWTLPFFKGVNSPITGNGETIDTQIMPSVGGKTVSYEMRNIMVYTRYSGLVNQIVDVRPVGSTGPRRIIYQMTPSRTVSQATYYAYLRRG